MATIPRALRAPTRTPSRMFVNGTTCGSGAMQSAQERKADCPRFHVRLGVVRIMGGASVRTRLGKVED